jgi:hypothetical protein
MAAMEEALIALHRGDFVPPLRPIVRAPGRPDLLGLMPTHRGGDRPLYGLKTVAVFPTTRPTASTRTRARSPSTTARTGRCSP